jgi:hypothetical protein
VAVRGHSIRSYVRVGFLREEAQRSSLAVSAVYISRTIARLLQPFNQVSWKHPKKRSKYARSGSGQARRIVAAFNLSDRVLKIEPPFFLSIARTLAVENLVSELTNRDWSILTSFGWHNGVRWRSQFPVKPSLEPRDLATATLLFIFTTFPERVALRHPSGRSSNYESHRCDSSFDSSEVAKAL